jgi:hypothetical protein
MTGPPLRISGSAFCAVKVFPVRCRKTHNLVASRIVFFAR